MNNIYTNIDASYFDALYKTLNNDEYNNYPYSNEDSKPYRINIANDLLMQKENITSLLYSNGFVIASFDKPVTLDVLKKNQVDIFGPVMPDVGKSHVEVSVIAPELNGKYFANSTYAQPLHTDEGHTTRFPRIASLFCAQQADIGGVSIIVPFTKIYDAISKKFPETLSLLFDEKAISVTNIYGIESKAILFNLPEQRIGISYSAIIQGLNCSEKVYEIYNYITNFVHNVDNQIRFKLKNNELLILDNCRTLHARTRFNFEDNRRLYRMWFPEFPWVAAEKL